MNLGKESERIEFKETMSELEAGLKSISSMLNRNKESTLYFGVKDNGDIIGIDIVKDTIIKIKEKMKAKIKPMVIPEIEVLKSDDGKDYIKVCVSGTNIPYSYDGRYYVRTGASDDQIDVHMLTNIIESKTDDRIREIKALSQDLTFDYVVNTIKKKGIHIDSLSAFYESYHLKTSKNEFNMTAYLLSDQNIIMIRVIQFAGKDRTKMIKKNEFSNQSLLKSFSDVMDYIKIFNTHRIDDMTKERIETPLFDEDSVREAIINAFVHNDWKKETPPTIFMFDDRFEIFSYGELPYGITQDMIFNGYSRPINRGLFTIFMLCQIAEQSGHGIPTIVKKYGKEAFDFRGSAIKVTIKYAFNLTNTKDDVAENVENVVENVVENRNNAVENDTVEQVFNEIKNNANISANDIAKILNKNLRTIQRAIATLKATNRIKRVGPDKGGHWEIKNN